MGPVVTRAALERIETCIADGVRTSIRRRGSKGDRHRFDAAEQAHIFEIWRTVSAQFAALNMNVTTVKPADMRSAVWMALANGARPF